MPLHRAAIICVDDEAIILLALKQELKRRFKDRFIVETALDAAEANAIVEELDARGVPTAMVVSDWLMPGTRGDEFLIDLHARKPHIKTLLVTGQADGESIERARREAGLCGCIHKPWRTDELASLIEACLSNSGSESCGG